MNYKLLIPLYVVAMATISLAIASCYNDELNQTKPEQFTTGRQSCDSSILFHLREQYGVHTSLFIHNHTLENHQSITTYQYDWYVSSDNKIITVEILIGNGLDVSLCSVSDAEFNTEIQP